MKRYAVTRVSKKEETARGNYTNAEIRTEGVDDKLPHRGRQTPTAENSNYRKSQKEPTATFNDMSKKDRGNHVIMNGSIPEKEV